MAKKNKKNPYAGLTNDQIIAAAAGDVQYGPEISQIKGLYTDLSKQRKSDISSAKQQAASTIAFTNAQRPKTQAVYDRGEGQADKTAADVSVAFGADASATPQLGSYLAAEQASQKNRIEEARRSALSELTSRSTGAKAGQQLAINQARSSYREGKGTLDQKLSDLLGQKGAFIAGKLATLGNEAANRQTKVDVAKIQAGGDKTITTGALTGKTPNWAKNHPQAAQRLIDKWNADHTKGGGAGGTTRAKTPARTDFSDQVSKAISYAKAGFEKGYTRQQVAKTLVQGSTIPSGGNASDRTPSFGQLIVTAANDVVYDGHISRQTADLLHKAGYKVSDLQNILSATDFHARGLREPHKDAAWQAKMRATQARLGGGGWTKQIAAALGVG